MGAGSNTLKAEVSRFRGRVVELCMAADEEVSSDEIDAIAEADFADWTELHLKSSGAKATAGGGK